MSARGREYWERHAARYDRATRFLARPVPRMLELAAGALQGRGRVLEVAAVLHLVPDLERALASLGRVLRPGGVLVAPTCLHRETTRAAALSRLLSLTGFPGARRFSARSLRAAVEGAGLRVRRAETIPGPLPIGHAEAMQRRRGVTPARRGRRRCSGSESHPINGAHGDIPMICSAFAVVRVADRGDVRRCGLAAY